MKYENNKIIYEIGDWVVVLDPGKYWASIHIDEILQIKEIEELSIGQKLYFITTNQYVYSDVVRPATFEEFKDAERKLSEVKIRGHKVERSGNNSITIGCKTFSINDINQVYRILDVYGISKVTLDELREIRDFIYRD